MLVQLAGAEFNSPVLDIQQERVSVQIARSQHNRRVVLRKRNRGS
jgi:hypothetical protein